MPGVNSKRPDTIDKVRVSFEEAYGHKPASDDPITWPDQPAWRTYRL